MASFYKVVIGFACNFPSKTLTPAKVRCFGSTFSCTYYDGMREWWQRLRVQKQTAVDPDKITHPVTAFYYLYDHFRATGSSKLPRNDDGDIC